MTLALRLAWLSCAALIWPSVVLAGPVGVLRADGVVAQGVDLQAVERALELEAGSARPAALPTANGPFWLRGARLDACVGSSQPVGAVLAQAKEHLRKLEADAALALLSSSLDAAPCSWPTASPSDIGTALDLLGQAAQDAGKDGVARDAYRRLLAVAPAWQLLSPPGSGYEVVWTEVRREILAQPQRSFVLWHQGAGVRLDGEAVPPESGATLPLVPGRHLLQWGDAASHAGAWLVLDPAPQGAAAIHGGAGASLLAAGGRSTASRQGNEIWLGALRTEVGADAIAVITVPGAEAQGFVVDDAGLRGWSLSADAGSAAIPLDRLRVGLGAGYALFGASEAAGVPTSSNLGIDADLDLRLVGPLHLRIDGSVVVSQPARLVDEGSGSGGVADGKAWSFPGFGVGAVVRAPRTVFQPFVGVVGGLWIHPTSFLAKARADIVALDPEGTNPEAQEALAALDRRKDHSPRILLEGGFDVVSPAAPIGLRVDGGVGYGPGFVARAGFHLVVRLGRVEQQARVGG